MNAASIAGWGLVGLLAGRGMLVFVQRSTTSPTPTPTPTRPLAPPVVLEAATAILFSALSWRIGAKPELFAYSWLAAISTPLAAIDWHTRQLPTKLIWPGSMLLIALLAGAAAANRNAGPLIRSLAGMLALVLFYGAIYVLRPGNLGGGDLRLGGLLGAALGWISWTAVLTGTLLGWLAAAVTVIVLRIVRRTNSVRDLPLGPFLIIGTFAAVLTNSSF